MIKVYIAHPLRDNAAKNIEKATQICRDLVEERNVIPFSPLHAFGFSSPFGDQFQAMQFCFALLSSCDEIWVHGEWWNSEGCKAEIAFAKCRGIPIRIQAKGGAGWIELPNPKRRMSA